MSAPISKKLIFPALILSLAIVFISCKTNNNNSALPKSADTSIGIKQDANKDSLKNNTTAVPDPDKLIAQIRKGETKVLFQGSFTEPFYEVYITDNEILYLGLSIKEAYTLVTKYDPHAESQNIKCIGSDGKINDDIIIDHKPGSDGMSDQIYPYSIKHKSKTDGGGGFSKLRSMPDPSLYHKE